jgi:hypothetical protein
VIPITPANDLARHLAMVENFYTALKAKQIFPRLQELTTYIHDVPVFQYYGFMTGLAAVPGILLGFSSLKALMLGILFFCIVGATVLYKCARYLGLDFGQRLSSSHLV